MKITVENTDSIVTLEINGKSVPARVWEGATDTGVPVVAFITRISPQTHDEEVNARFAAELLEMKKPTFDPFSRGIPLRFFMD